MTRAFLAILRRDLALSLGSGGGAGLGVVFFLCVITVVPFAVGPDLALLARIGPAILWIGALLASLIGLERLFTADVEDGSLDNLTLSALPLELVAAAKGLAHWLATGLPLVIAAPVLALMLNLEPAAIAAVVATLLVGTPAVTFLGLIGAAFAGAFRRGGLLIAVLVIPLAIPVLIFAVSATTSAVTGPVPFGTPFRVLLGLALFSLVLGPVAAAAALRAARG
ncbi:heme exporter protein CcmB [Xanthobacter tagetidis]|uniref:Heme exporter protein B n=1 Tax=Xanthobacter tagetidis TaxID=60216 RepID=A0A3L7AFQ0_9HYPH|nr:heme exporter protein CcmB [Xanthobacter tagetidis]MBB6306600.1 heme exporter protein B [Xanthobacter tagetidis]RLP79077.1 heme exporter protein CcmB [Xanthobacter tagetidis]